MRTALLLLVFLACSGNAALILYHYHVPLGMAVVAFTLIAVSHEAYMAARPK